MSANQRRPHSARKLLRRRLRARISHTHGPKRTPGNRNLLTRKTVTREARIPTDLTACRMGDTDFQLVAVKEQVSQVRHHARWRRRSGNADLRSAQRPAGPQAAHCRAFTGRRHGAHSAANGVCHSNVRITPNAGIPAEKEPPRNSGSFPPPAFGGLCRPEVGVPLPARRSAWWRGRHAQVQRSRGAFCDSASAPEYEKCELERQLMTALRTLSAQSRTRTRPCGGSSSGSTGERHAWLRTTGRSPRRCAGAGRDAPARPGAGSRSEPLK